MVYITYFNTYPQKCMAFPVLIFMKLSTAQLHYVQILYTKFYPNETLTVETMDINLLTCQSKVWLSSWQFSQHWHSHNILQWTSHVTVVSQLRWRMKGQEGGVISLMPLRKYCFHCTSFIKFTVAQQQYVEISCSRVHQNWSWYMEIIFNVRGCFMLPLPWPM